MIYLFPVMASQFVAMALSVYLTFILNYGRFRKLADLEG